LFNGLKKLGRNINVIFNDNLWLKRPYIYRKNYLKRFFFLEKIEIEPGSFSVCVWFAAGVFWHPTDAKVRET
jgi:hypothetical protein